MLFDGIRLVEGSEISNASVATGDEFPALPNAGELFFLNDTNILSLPAGLYTYDGDEWVTSSLSFVPVNRAGDTMTGLLTLSGPPTANLHAATKKYVDDEAAATLAAALAADTTLTGDVTGVGSSTITTTLANTAVTAGSYGGAADVGTFTVDAKGRLTAAANVSIAISASQVTTGTLADTRVAVSNVTQHQGALTITESQISDGSILARVADNETITGAWSFSVPTSGQYPTLSGHLATKQYVDDLAQGILTKPAARAATTGNLSATYNNGVSGVGATLTGTGSLPAIDSVTLSVGDGILVKNQTAALENGRYVVTATAPNWVLTRCGLCDEAHEIPGAYVFVQAGGQAGTGWVQIVANPATFTVGTDAITVTQFSAAGASPPGGSDTHVQFNNSGTFGGSANLTWNGTALSVTGNLNVNGDQNSTFVSTVRNTNAGSAAATYVRVGNDTSDNAGVLRISSTNTLSGQTTARSVGLWNADSTGSVFLGAGGVVRLNVNSVGRVGIAAQPTLGMLHVASSTLDAVGDPTILVTGSNNRERIQIRSNAVGVFSGLASGGTVESPTATPAGQDLASFHGGGYDGSQWIRSAWLGMRSTETWSGSGRGTKVFISTTANGSTTIQERILIENGGNVIINTPVSGNALETLGNVRVNSNAIIIGADTSGLGGNVRLVRDNGEFRWLAGLLGTAGASSYTLYDVVRGATVLSANTSGNVVINAPTSGTTFTVNGLAGQNAAVLDGGTAGSGNVHPFLATGSTPATVACTILNTNTSGASAFSITSGNGAVTSFFTSLLSAGVFGTSTNHPLEFRTNNTVRGTISAAGNWSITNDLSVGGVISGNGSGLISLNGSNVTTGTIADARLSSNVALRNVNNNFSSSQTIAAGSSSVVTINASSSPQLRMENTGVAVNNRNWIAFLSGTSWQLRPYTDDYSTSTAALSVARSGSTAGAVSTYGNVDVGGNQSGIGRLIANVGSSARSGYVAFHNASGGREGYIGWSPTTGGGDIGTVEYVAGRHDFYGSARTSPTSVSFSSSPTFNARTSNVFYFGTLTGNVTSMTISNPWDGQSIQIRFVQDSTGSRTVALPSGTLVSGSINPAANSVSWLVMTYVDSAGRWEGTWTRTA